MWRICRAGAFRVLTTSPWAQPLPRSFVSRRRCEIVDLSAVGPVAQAMQDVIQLVKGRIVQYQRAAISTETDLNREPEELAEVAFERDRVGVFASGAGFCRALMTLAGGKLFGLTNVEAFANDAPGACFRVFGRQ
jgi:hypothetical protein